ncbi:UvrB/UvrC motif-containing protein [Shouchella shacheensis]|uniref:UvrB/UvrC motif-containing protein n=1 Tax=Shouchella shacheensis TaxID=1649580 RepID=UPI000740261F|nr:UvrB/UvrC motif-containing protein [Shouchella shacheensis]
MLCKECQKRQATLHFTKIINGEKTEMHVCEQCARSKGESIPGSDSFSIHHLFSGLFNLEANEPSEGRKQQKEKECQKCGMTYEKFQRVGRFGCAECYTTFGNKLDPIFRRVHAGNDTHYGKIPKRIGKTIQVEKEIQKLRDQLKIHVEREEFEDAAELRDQIKELKNPPEQAGEEE